MPSDVDDLFAEMGAPNMQAAMGETVIQWPLGMSSAAVTLAGVIVDISELGETPIDDDRGSQVVYWGKLLIPVSVVVTDAERSQQRDEFIVRGLNWQCEKVVSQGLALQTVRIRRSEGISTKRTRARAY